MIEPVTTAQMQCDYLIALYNMGQVILKDPPKRTPREMAIDYAAVHRIRLSDFLGETRERAIAWPRQDCMAMIKRSDKTLSLSAIGRAFNRDHSTVHHAIEASNKRAGE